MKTVEIPTDKDLREINNTVRHFWRNLYGENWHQSQYAAADLERMKRISAFVRQQIKAVGKKRRAIYPTLTKSGRKVADIYHGEEMGPNRCAIILCLVLDKPPSRATIAKWSEERRRHAANWAIREHQAASDNPTLRIAKPDWLKVK